MLDNDDAEGAVGGGSCDDSEASAKPFSFAKVRVDALLQLFYRFHDFLRSPCRCSSALRRLKRHSRSSGRLWRIRRRRRNQWRRVLGQAVLKIRSKPGYPEWINTFPIYWTRSKWRTNKWIRWHPRLLCQPQHQKEHRRMVPRAIIIISLVRHHPPRGPPRRNSNSCSSP